MKIAIPFFMLLFVATSLAAQDHDDIIERAFKHFHSKNFDSSILLFRLAKANDTTDRKLHLTYMLARSYEASGNESLAAQEYLASLDIPLQNRRSLHLKNVAASQLSTHFKEKKDYRNALWFLRLSRDSFPEFRMCGMGAFERKIAKQALFFDLYDKLGYTDSAIASFTPYAFENPQIYYDSTEYAALVNQYYKVLGKKFTPCQIAENFSKSLSDARYVKDSSGECGETHWTIDYSMQFQDCKVTLLSTCVGKNDWNAQGPTYYSREAYLRQLENTPAYQLIMNGLNSCPIISSVKGFSRF
jgi:hypothetical protein